MKPKIPRAGRGGSRAVLTRLIVTCVISVLIATTARAQERSIHFDISNQSLSQALLDYARTCDVDLIFTEDLVAGITVTSLKGECFAQGSLDRLLRGTGLIAKPSPAGALMIQRGDTAKNRVARR